MAIQGDKVGLYLASKEIIVPDCNIILEQPSVKNVLLFGEEKFLSATQLIGHLDQVLNPIKEAVQAEMPLINDLQLLLYAYHQDISVQLNLHDFFEFIFPAYDWKIMDAAIEFSQENELKGMITPFNLENLSNLVLDLFEPNMMKKENYNPKSKKAKEIAEKIRKGKEKKAQQGSGDMSQSLFGMYLSILSIGMSIDINKLLKYTPFQLFDAFDRFILKQEEDYYKLLSSSGFLDTSKIDQPDSWLKNLYD